MTPRASAAVLVFLCAFAVVGVYSRGKAERRARDAEAQVRDAEIARDAAERSHDARERDLATRLGNLSKQVADLEASGREREKELLVVRAELERARRIAEEEVRRPAPVSPKPAPEKPPIEAAPAAKAPAEKPPAPSLGPTAVSDPNQVKKLTDGLNTLLAGVEGTEKWKVVSAKAAEDDRLVQVVLEARGADGTVVKSFQAGEARLVLQAAAGTLSIKLKDGSVTYPGNRTVPFPDGAYTVLLVVDSGPFRAAGNPLISIH
jgi:hypothetical protein